MTNVVNKSKTINLQALLKDIVQGSIPNDINITGVTCDSRKVEPGNLFIAFEGDTTSGSAYIPQALTRGAVAVVTDQPLDVQPGDACVLYDSDIRTQCGEVASRFYGEPSKNMQVIGVTGTNGKTSITHFIGQALMLADQPCGIAGTLGYGMFGALTQGQFTTPQVTQMQRILGELHNEGAQAVAMEVSSHGLVQQRVNGIHFDTAIFSNLSHDHLDYHGDMESYWQAKQKLFDWPGLKNAIINIDDDRGHELATRLASTVQVITTSLKGRTIDNCKSIVATKVHQTLKGTQTTIDTSWGPGVIKSHLLGRFNVSNLLAALALMLQNSISIDLALPIISRLDTVPGRMQCIRNKGMPLVVVDYAHTPDALEHALRALRHHTTGKLWCVFGCGGGRDRLKRKVMGQVAERYSDQLIITNDNPRDENPEDIIADILKGLLCSWAAEIVIDRGAAIATAMSCAGANDIVLIAGKGHEQYQQIGNQKIPFNDVQQVNHHVKHLREKR